MTTQLYAAAALIAAPIVKSYLVDLEKYDREAFEGAESGHCYLWAPRECGTQLVSIWKAPADDASGESVWQHVKRVRGAVEWFSASESVFAGLQWHLIQCDGAGAGSIRKISTSAARQLVDTTAARAEPAWRRRHQ